MTQSSDAEFETIIHSDETHISSLESDDVKHLREELAPAHATEVGELPVQSNG
ncbi:MAG TPA: hypothetical protein VGF80_12895 [Galbitalea sp.]|jgi:hypothetical protein